MPRLPGRFNPPRMPVGMPRQGFDPPAGHYDLNQALDLQDAGVPLGRIRKDLKDLGNPGTAQAAPAVPAGAAQSLAVTLVQVQGLARPEIMSVFLGQEYNIDATLQGIGFIDRPPLGLAVIQWGCYGSTYIAHVDYVLGCILNIPCQSLKVDFINEDAVTGLGAIAQRVSAYLAYGPHPSPKAPTRTNRLNALGAGLSTVAFNIPPFAKSFNIGRSPQAATNFTVVINDRAGTVIEEHIVGIGNDLGRIEIPNDGRTLIITNNSGVAVTFRTVFQLAL